MKMKKMFAFMTKIYVLKLGNHKFEAHFKINVIL